LFFISLFKNYYLLLRTSNASEGPLSIKGIFFPFLPIFYDFITNFLIMKRLIFLAFIALNLTQLKAQADFEKSLQTLLISVESGNTVTINEGTFSLKKSMSIDGKKDIVIRGQGIGKTILSFKNQTSGAEGLRITNCENIRLEDMTVQDSKGDLIKAMHVKGITFRRVKAEWTGKVSSKNGGYGIYPVQCQGVMIDSCIVRGASDAGIYVGQSSKIEVKNCTATENVAGIEIENSLYADVYNNTATHNTGGILVFDLPDLVQKQGGFVRVFYNNIIDNNLANFAPKGNIVAKVPQGTGVLVLATNNVHIYENKIINNNSASVGIISYFMTENPIKDSLYYPYPTSVYVHDNTFERQPVRATMKGRFGKIFLFKLKFGKDVPHVLYDGIIDPKLMNPDGTVSFKNSICIKNNKNQSVGNMDAANGFKNVSKEYNIMFDCALGSFIRN
jgi:parallel beta-helix repeat protein